MSKEINFLGFEKDIEVFDDIIPQEMADSVEKTVTADVFPWYLLRDIEKTRAERLQAQMFIANTMAPPPEAEENPEVQSEMKKNFNEVRIDPTKMDGKAAAEQIKRTLKSQNNEDRHRKNMEVFSLKQNHLPRIFCRWFKRM